MSDDKPQAVDQQKVLGQTEEAVSQLDKEKDAAVADYADKDKKDSDERLSMSVRVHSPFKQYYDGQAFSISAENATGPFDILPKHHNFISLLSPCDIVIRSEAKDEQRIRISGGMMHVKADQVIVFLDV